MPTGPLSQPRGSRRRTQAQRSACTAGHGSRPSDLLPDVPKLVRRLVCGVFSSPLHVPGSPVHLTPHLQGVGCQGDGTWGCRDLTCAWPPSRAPRQHSRARNPLQTHLVHRLLRLVRLYNHVVERRGACHHGDAEDAPLPGNVMRGCLWDVLWIHDLRVWRCAPLLSAVYDGFNAQLRLILLGLRS